MKRILPVLSILALITACSPKSPSADFPEGKWGINFGGQLVGLYTFNPDHTLTDPDNHPGTWSISGTHLILDIKISTPGLFTDKLTTSTKHQDVTIVAKTSDTVTVNDATGPGFGMLGNTVTLKYLPPVSQ